MDVQQILDLYRQFAHTDACRVIGCRGNRGRDTGQSDLADPARTYGVEFFIRIIEECTSSLGTRRSRPRRNRPGCCLSARRFADRSRLL